MELKELIEELLKSDVVENQNLAVNLLRSDEVSDEEKEVYIGEFVKKFVEGKIDLNSTVNKDIFKQWVDLYCKYVMKNDVKKRVKKI